VAEPKTTSVRERAAAVPQPVPGRPRVIAAAVERSRRRGVIRKLNRVVENGGTALMITADGCERPEELHPAVQVLDLQAGERRLGINALLTRDPARGGGRAPPGPPPGGGGRPPAPPRPTASTAPSSGRSRARRS